MGLARRTRFEWTGGGAGLEMTLSTRPWTPQDMTIGGSRTAAAGEPASYIVRRDYLVTLPLRFLEDEWGEVLAFIIFAQSAQPVTWFPDAEEPASFDVYLQTPAAGETWSPSRASEFPRMLELTLTLRGAGSIPWEPFFA